MIKKILKNTVFFVIGAVLLFSSFTLILLSTTPLPDFKSFEARKVVNSTKIYERTGKVILYNVHENIKRTTLPFDQMGTNIKNATIAIEDSNFYQHKGIRVKSILRAFWTNVVQGGLNQGGSTITQQILKNTLLTHEKTIKRKIKEWILSVKIESSISKDEILEAYLNEAPYGGVIYGVYEASMTYFKKEPKDLTLAEAAYLAAMPKAPTFYSPYGKNKEKLDKRENIVLKRMLEIGFISEEDYDKAIIEEITFLPQQNIKIKAPHFVFYIKDYLEQKYGPDVMDEGLRVITTLDWSLQEKAEEIVARISKLNEKNFNGKNASLVAIDPKTGQILAMVGSRDYFDKEIDGAYNVALAYRQPGSAFKPFIYANAFAKGYTPDTILFDVPIEFQTTCDVYGKALPGKKQKDCYSPDNYDNKFRGFMTMKDALAQSINVPAVETLYLVGVGNAIKTARDMGITTLADPSRYGLTLVIGGGEVSLLDITSAYASFATGGIKNPVYQVLKVTDAKGKVLEEFKSNNSRQVLDKNVALEITDILSDNNARVPTFGANSNLYIPGYQVAAKTGTTDNNRDAWTIGYTPSIAVGVWVGNNENTPMKKGGAALAGPIWNAFMKEAVKSFPVEEFEKPKIDYDLSLPPILRGIWQGGETFLVDKISGKLATENTPKETIEERTITNVHSILYWIDKNDPKTLKIGGNPSDYQLSRWEIPVLNWWEKNKYKYNTISVENKPTEYDDVHVPEKMPKISIIEPVQEKIYGANEQVVVKIANNGSTYALKKADVFVNDNFLGTMKNEPWSFTFNPSELENLGEINTIKVVVEDSVYNTGIAETTFNIQN